MFDSYIALVNKVRLEMHLTFVEIAHSAAAHSLMWTSQGHTAPVHQSPQGPPLLLLVAISSAEGFSDAVWAVNWYPIPKDIFLLPLYLLVTLQVSWGCFAAASRNHFMSQGWRLSPPPEQISPLGRALEPEFSGLQGVMQVKLMLFTVDCPVLFYFVGFNFLWNDVCVFVVAKTLLS